MHKHNSSTQKNTSKRLGFTPRRVAVLYAIFATLWIVASGKLLLFTVNDAVLQEHIELAKGLIFVAITSGLLYQLLKVWHGKEEAATTIQNTEIHPSRIILLFVALMLVVPLFGIAISTLYSTQIERDAYANLETVAKFKAEQIENWLHERQGDSVILMNSEDFIKHIEQFIQKPTASSQKIIQKRFDILRNSYNYDSLLLIDLNGQLLFSVGDDVDIHVDLQQLLRQSLTSNKEQRGDFYRDEKGNVHLDWVVPIVVTDTTGKHAIASVVLRTTAHHFLFPLLQTWPTTSISAETLLLQHEGESVIFLNTLRHRADTAQSLRLPLSQLELPAATAIRSGNLIGITKGLDYRNIEVLNVYYRIKGTNCYLIAKIDHNEVSAPLHKLVLLVSLIAFIAIVVISMTLFMLWQQQQQERSLVLWTQQATLETALASMNDAVFISDTNGRFINFNEAFATFHKFKNKQECAKTLAEYPKFIALYTTTSGDFLPFEQWPVPRALRGESGTNAEFILHRKDTNETWVGSYSYAPIRNKEGLIIGSVVTARDISERKKMEEAIITSEKEFRLLAEAMPQIVWITDADGKAIYINRQWVDYTGFSLEESYGDGWITPFYPDDQKRVWDGWQKAVDNNAPYSFECQLRRADGIYRWWLIRSIPIVDEHGNVYKWFGTCTDIHELKETEKSLRDSESRLQFTLQTSKTGGWDLNLDDYTAHRTLEHDRIFGYDSLLPQWNYQMFLEHVIPQDRDAVDRLFHKAITTQTNWDFECRIHRLDGELRWIWAAGRHIPNEQGFMRHMVGIVQDITERKKAEETIYDLAYYDPLTHLANRRLMQDRLKQALISRKLKHQYGAVLFIDLNDFKTLNDTKGHDIGDLLLIEVSTHLKTAVHEDDTVARTGGNEFVVLLDALDMATNLAAAQAEGVAKRILCAIGQPFDLQGYEYCCSASIGIALFHSYEISVDELIKQADMAIHYAKQVGKNTICFFDPAVQAALESRVQLEAWMRKALNGQYRLYFQLQIDHNDKATGAEALIRWYHPERGIISPTDFIPLAEQIGLILSIGQWVLEAACIQLKAWEDSDSTRHLILAVNVSAKQLQQPDFVGQVLTVLENTGANPNKLKLELTESMLLDNVEDIITKMNILKAKGVKFSLDDFGTGFSSLSYLKRLPLDQLKIDQSFVHDALTNPNDAAIICTIIALGQSLGMDVIAEGVETEAQRQFLATHGCNQYQGYLFSKPLPLEEFEQLLHQSSVIGQLC